MAYETETASASRGTLGPALASVVVGGLLGGALVFTATNALFQAQLPETATVVEEQALLGGPEYGER